MTRESSVFAGDVGDWKQQLADAFEILLDRPLSSYDPDAVYATYLGGNFIDEIGYNRHGGWVRPAALSGAEPVVWDYPPYDQGEPPLVFDASGSIFEFAKSNSGLPPEFTADLDDASFSQGLIRGADLAPLLVRHELDLAGPEWSDKWYVCYPRIVSDGTLFDAMRVAVGIGHGPESLLPFEAEATEEWQEALAAVTHPRLRAHLSFFCTDGEEGLGYLREDRSGGSILAEEGCSLIANWEEGQCQIEFAVVQLSDLVAGPRLF
ncbi:hypothetical protein ABZ260_47040 [Streptosporangium sp. NPDC006013]|uniref:hypothetical protein n=1 Tax=Streptosporangium sp. NPDC006013 TaxID=3155596 RepID=UPI0033B30F0A